MTRAIVIKSYGDSREKDEMLNAREIVKMNLVDLEYQISRNRQLSLWEA